MDIADIRRLTPATEQCIYYQTSGFSPKPRPVLEEVVRWMEFQNRGPALGHVHEKLLEQLELTRAHVARALNAAPEEIMLNENTTIGINIVAFGIDWRPGDNVILSDHEHPGNRIPWYGLVTRYGIELRYLTLSNNPQEMLDQFEALVGDRTRLASLSHVSRRSGLRLPARELIEIAHAKGVPVLLDGAQAFGAIPVDVKELNCDFYACSGHKYIMAPQGTGAFYVRRDMVEWLKPSWIGSHSQEDMDFEGHMTLKDSALRFEFGTRNLCDQTGFRKALEMWEEIGWSKVFARIAEGTDYMKEQLLTVPGLQVVTPRPYEQSAGIVTFRIPGQPSAKLCPDLMEHYKILVGGLELDPYMVRVSTHVFNTEAECDTLVSGLKRIISAS